MLRVTVLARAASPMHLLTPTHSTIRSPLIFRTPASCSILPLSCSPLSSSSSSSSPTSSSSSSMLVHSWLFMVRSPVRGLKKPSQGAGRPPKRASGPPPSSSSSTTTTVAPDGGGVAGAVAAAVAKGNATNYIKPSVAKRLGLMLKPDSPGRMDLPAERVAPTIHLATASARRRAQLLEPHTPQQHAAINHAHSEKARQVISEILYNSQVKFEQVRVVDTSGDLGVFAIAEAMQLARERKTDLVLVAASAKPPVCKLQSYAVYAAERQALQQHKETRATAAGQTIQVSGEQRLLQVGPRISDHDLATKMRKAREMIMDGTSVRIALNVVKDISDDELRGTMTRCEAALSDIAQITTSIANLRRGNQSALFVPGAKKVKAAASATVAVTVANLSSSPAAAAASGLRATFAVAIKKTDAAAAAATSTATTPTTPTTR